MPAAGAARRKLCEQYLLLHGAGGVEQAPSRAMRTAEMRDILCVVWLGKG